MRIALAGVTKTYGAHTVLDCADLVVAGRARLGVVGPNGSGKSTVLRLLAGAEEPDAGSVERSPAGLAAGYLPQERDAPTGETLLTFLASRTGVAAAERELERHAERWEPDAYAAALERFLALGGGDLEHRAAAVCAELGLPVALEQETATLSGGEAARAGLAALLLSRFDVLLLDEPTNDLDFDGLDRLERFVAGFRGPLAVVSHDRAFLDRVVERIAEVDPWTRRIREWDGGWSHYEAARTRARERQYDTWERTEERRREVAALLNERRNQARAGGAMANRRGTQALRSKVRQAERSLARAGEAAKPYEPWELRLSLGRAPRTGDTVAALTGAVAERGSFRLGPLDLELAPGERLAVTGRNGSGKSTLLALLLGELEPVAGHRVLGRATVAGSLDQGRAAYATETPLLAAFTERTGLPPEEARTLLAKFDLRGDHVGRAGDTLSAGERTRAQVAELAALGVNLLVLDEPTNHLDLEAIEQLETALDAYAGALVVVSHDRRFLERVAPTRELAL